MFRIIFYLSLYASGGRVMQEVNRLLGTSTDRVFKYLLATYHCTRNEQNNNVSGHCLSVSRI